ncbi:MAG: DUF362 domain-containing protein [Phycisphaerae bacterium]
MTSKHPSEQSDISRRRFLHGTAATIGGLASTTAATALAQTGARQSESKSNVEPLVLSPNVSRSRVVHIRSQFAHEGYVVHTHMFRELLETTITQLVGADDLPSCWNKLFRKSDVIGIKFNRSGQDVLATTDIVAHTIVETLLEAGFQSKQIACLELPRRSELRKRTLAVMPGFEREPSKFASGEDQLSNFLNQVTAIINVPFLKTHNIAKMTCTLKNLSHGLTKHPANFHGNHCTPFIADICNIPKIKDKVKLHLVDALRVVYDGGPSAQTGTIGEHSGLIASRDPVACDAVGFGILNQFRESYGLHPIAESLAHVPYLADAHRKNLGVAVPHGMDLIYAKIS